MPKINFSFRGYGSSNIEEATNAEGNTVNVSAMDADILADKLEKGELFISLVDHVYGHRKNEVEIFDFGKVD